MKYGTVEEYDDGQMVAKARLVRVKGSIFILFFAQKT